MQSPYQCKKCKIGAMVVNGEVVRFCKCKAPIVMVMQAKVEGKATTGA